MERVQVVQDGGRSMADGGDAVTSGGTSAGAGVTLDAGEPRLEVMLTAADPLTGLLLADRLAEHQMVVQEVAFDDMVERSRVDFRCGRWPMLVVHQVVWPSSTRPRRRVCGRC